MQPDVKSLLINLLAGVLLIASEKWLLPQLDKSNPLYRKYRLPVFGSIWVILNVFYIRQTLRDYWLFLIVTSTALAWIIYRELDQFWSLGLVGADKEVRSGINYERALRMCSSSLDFLGIGAGKLRANQPTFEAALDRCNRPDRPIRFLLCRPTDAELRKIAKSAGHDAGTYQRGVIESLRALSHLRNDRERNIKVRLYDAFPVFRLMFINDRICLVSHYVLGKGGDGSEAPQLHIVKANTARDVESLYFAFQSYFERIWDESEEWDFNKYLTGDS